ncbi:MAG: MucR family transcriptional regulator [Alphaproteobacteria bacterium]|nr:MucR family transcriptional regulator [Alphaproteobacteria bacterium]
MEKQNDLMDLTVEIVAAYVGNNMLRPSDIPGLISEIHNTLNELTRDVVVQPEEPLKPAINPKKSVTPDFIICLEDGMKFRSLKRHLQSRYGLTPDDYRRRWGLGADYPMVAPNYSKARSALAKKMGLGQKAKPSRR